MTTPHLARIEAQLERLIEGAFAHLFRQRVTAQDLLLHLTRAFDEQAGEPAQDDDPRELAPDSYVIYLHPDVLQGLLDQEPHLVALLVEHINELCAARDYRLMRLPSIKFTPDENLSPADVSVEAAHQSRPKMETAALQRIEVAPPERPIANPHLIVNGDQMVELDGGIVNVGRSRDNEIILNDPFVSRHHAQLRLRFGAYTLFDNDSQHGTFVNDVRVHEHRLQPGDVIMMGKSKLIYVEDESASAHSQTAIYPLL